jgi:hypothetical protein
MSIRDLLEEAAGAPGDLDIGELRARAAAYRHRRALTRLAIPAVALAAAAAVVAAVVSGGQQSRRVVAPSPGPAPSPPSTGPGLAPQRFLLGDLQITAVASGAGAVWVGGDHARCHAPCGVVARVDPSSGQVVETVPTGATPIDMAVDGGGVWVLADVPDSSPYRLVHIDAATGAVDVTTTIAGSVVGNANPSAHIAVGAGAVWVAAADDPAGPRLVRVDPATGRTVATIALTSDDAAHAVAADAAGVWVEAFASGHLTRVDPGTNRIVGRVQLGDGFLNSLAADDLAVWATQGGPNGSTLVRIDPASGRVIARLPVPATTVAVGDGEVWVSGYNPTSAAADARPGYVGRVDLRTDTVAQSTTVPASIDDTHLLAVGAAGVWLGTGNTDVLDQIAGPSSPSPLVTPEGCPTTFLLPFTPTYLPPGWRPVIVHEAHANAGTDFVEVWDGTDATAKPYGVIEVWRGADIPTPDPPTTPVTVLGHPAQLGLISDGSSVVFNTGSAADPCTRWALVAHPGVTPSLLRAVAEGLIPVPFPPSP